MKHITELTDLQSFLLIMVPSVIFMILILIFYKKFGSLPDPEEKNK